MRVEMHARLLVLVADSTVHAVMGDQCRECGAFLRELDWSTGVALRPRILPMDERLSCASSTFVVEEGGGHGERRSSISS